MLYMLGGAGVGNFGDELMVRKWLDFYAGHGLLKDITVDGSHSQVLTDLFSSKYHGVQYISLFNALRANGPKDFWKSLRRGLRFYDNGGFHNYPQYQRWIKELEKIKVLHLHGGGYLNNLWPHAAFLLGVAVATKEKYGCKLVATGIGFLPVNDIPSDHVDEFNKTIESFDFFECRDYPSAAFINKIIGKSENVFYGLDDTYIDHLEAYHSKEKKLHLSFFTSVMQSLNGVLNQLPADLDQKFDEILFWGCTSDDLKCFDVIKTKRPNIRAISLRDLVLDPLPVSPGDVMITARFHPHLLAARMGAVGYYKRDASYYDVKQGSVTDLGSPFKALEDLDFSVLPEAPLFNRITLFESERVSMKKKLGNRIVEIYKNE